MMKKILHSRLVACVQKVIQGWRADNVLSPGAALAFYSVVALPALLFVLVGVAGLFLRQEIIRDNVLTRAESVLGTDSRYLLEELLDRSVTPEGGLLQVLIGGVLFLLTITRVFGHVQVSLNKMWNLDTSKRRGWSHHFQKKAVALAVFLFMGLLFVVSIVFNTLIVQIDRFFSSAGHAFELAWLSNVIVGWVVFSLLFAVLFKVLPAASIRFQDALVGGMLTAILFVLGQNLLAFYFRFTHIGSSFGLTGSLVVLLIWVYYSAQIFFLGAEITQVYAKEYGQGIALEKR